MKSQAIRSLPSSLVHLSSVPYAMHRNRINWTLSLPLPPPSPPLSPSPFPSLCYLRGLHVVQARLLEFTPFLTHLQIRGTNEARIISHPLPPTLTHLALDWCALAPARAFPRALRQLSIGIRTAAPFRWEQIKDLSSLTHLIVHMDESPEFMVLQQFSPPSLPPSLTHLRLFFYEPGEVQISINCSTLTHLLISVSYPDQMHATNYIPNPFKLSLSTPRLTHLDVRLPSRYIPHIWTSISSPSLCSLPSLTHLSLGKIAEVTCAPPPSLKIALEPFSSLTHLRFTDSIYVHLLSLPPLISHLSLGEDCTMDKKINQPATLKFIFLPSSFSSTKLHAIRKRFPNAEFTFQPLHIVKSSKYFSRMISFYPLPFPFSSLPFPSSPPQSYACTLSSFSFSSVRFSVGSQFGLYLGFHFGFHFDSHFRSENRIELRIKTEPNQSKTENRNK